MYKKDIKALEKQATLWWPEDLKNEAAKISVIPKLLDTQDDFISILQLSKDSPFQIFDLIESSRFPANLFLKHLVVLADYGGETIQRLNQNFADVFEDSNDSNQSIMRSFFKEEQFEYVFLALPIKGTLNNKKLGLDGESISQPSNLDDLTKDMIMILLFGANAINASGADLSKCEIGKFIGQKNKLNNYIKQKYIWVSRITNGATSNSHGQIAQQIVFNYLRDHLDSSYNIQLNGKILLDNYSNLSGMPFDLVVERDSKKIGIEVSFQVTTNSVIERKAGQAQSRQHYMHNQGYKVAYLIDGAGNFQRKNAVSTICQYSDCTIAFSEQEFQVLLEYITKELQ